MKHSTGLIALLIWGVIPTAQAQFEKAFEVCSIETDSAKRLVCYDQFAAEIRELDLSSISAREEASMNVTLPLAPATHKEKLRPYVPRGLSSDGPNYLGISNAQKFSARGDRGEQNHIEFNLSIKYPLFINDKSVNSGSNAGLSIRWPGRAYFIYNGAYDFHALNSLNNVPRFNDEKLDWYRSAPVISRDQNPGLALEWDLVKDGSSRFRLAVMHHSNGQQKSIDDDATQLEKERLSDEIKRFISGPEGEDYALQDISRSSNYVSLRYQHILHGRVDGEVDWEQVQFELRPYYFGIDDEVFWEDGSSSRAKLTDYDGIRFLWEHYDGNSIFNLFRV